MAWITEKMKDEAKRADLIHFLQEKHPDMIVEKEAGVYAYSGRRCITFYRGHDGYFRYCDHGKRKRDETDYFGDGIRFLKEFVGGYTFETAALALLEFAEQ